MKSTKEAKGVKVKKTRSKNRSCETCYHYRDGYCQLWDGRCMNSTSKPSWLSLEDAKAQERRHIDEDKNG